MSEQASAAAEWRAHWTLVLTGALGMALAATMSFALGVMIIPIEQEYGWTRAEISSGPLLVSITGVLLATAAGYVIDRLGARIVGIMVTVTMAGVIALLGTTTSLWHWWLVWGIFSLAATFTSTVWLTPVSSLFDKGRGLAIAITLTGTGISQATVPLIANYFVEHHGWRTGYFALGALFAITTLPLVLLFWRGAEEFSSKSTGQQEASSTAVLSGATVREGFTSPNFYKILLGFLISSVAGVAIVLNLVPILISNDVSAGQAAMIAGAYGLASLPGRFIGGWAMDRINAKWLVTAVTLASAALPLGLLIGPGTVAIALAGVLIHGFMGGVKFPGIVYLISRYFGARSFGTLFGTISTATSIASGVGPLVANYVYDVTRSYTPVMWVAAPAFLIAALLFASLGRYPDYSWETRQPALQTGGS